MKKLYALVTFSLFIFYIYQINSQICTINYSYTQPGIYPDTLPIGYVGQLYSDDVTFVMPLDTMGATITNFNIINIALPVGLSWQCNNISNGCNYDPQTNQYGCVNIFGTPLLAGSYDIEVSLLVNVEISGQTINNIPSSLFAHIEIITGSPGGGNTGFSMNNASGCLPVFVDFYNNNPGLIAYNWNFGNGNTSSLENPPSQQYNTEGEYIVTYEAYSNTDTVDLYTLTNITVESVNGTFSWGPEIFNGNKPDPYIILYENGNLIYQTPYVYNNSGPISWSMNIMLDPNNMYEITVMDADASAAGDNQVELILYGSDDIIGSHNININGCNNCTAGSSDISYSISYQQIFPVPSIQSTDTIHVYDYPGQPNIIYDTSTNVLSTDSTQYALQWYLNDTLLIGHTNSTDTISITGYYHVLAFNNYGCATSSDTILAIYCDPNFSITVNIDSNLDLFTVVPQNWNIQWYNGNSIIPGAINDVYSPAQSGIFTVIATDSLGCSYTSTPYVYTVGIKTYINDYWSMYPNPANNILNIIWSKEINTTTLDIYDLSGRLIKNWNIYKKDNLKIQVGKIPKGTYIVKLSSDIGELSKIFIIN